MSEAISIITRTFRDAELEGKLERRLRAMAYPDAAIAKAFRQAEEAIHKGFSLCHSSIEQRLLPYLVFADYGPYLDSPGRVHDTKNDRLLPGWAVFIAPQFYFVRYRIDLAVVGRVEGQTKIVAVECDGKNYHAADADRVRDEYLKDYGIKTVRVSGGDVFRDPQAAATKVSELFQEWAEGICG